MVLLAVDIVKQSRAAASLQPSFSRLLVVTIWAGVPPRFLWRLGGLYRVGSFVGLAVSLALVAVVLQRFVLTPDTKKKEA